MILEVTELRKSHSTPYSNTGCDSHSHEDAGLGRRPDYLVLCGDGYLCDVVDAIWAAFGTVFDFGKRRPGVRGQRYDTIVNSAQGIELAYEDTEYSDGRRAIRISIPGKPIGSVAQERVHWLAQFFADREYHCTRFDVAIDDYTRTLSLDSIKDCCESGDYTGANEFRYYKRKRRGEWQPGQTIYIGATTSDKQVRIYDKEIESKGTTKSIRYEVQYRDSLAQSVFLDYTQSPDAVAANENISRVAVSAVSFLHRTDVNLKRCRRYRFWESFIGRVGTPRTIQRIQTLPLLSRKIAWIERQVAGTLATVVMCKGFRWLEDWIHRITIDALGKTDTTRAAFVATWRDRQRVEQQHPQTAYDRLKLELSRTQLLEVT